MTHIVQRLFRYVWVDGHLPNNEPAFTALCDEFALVVDDINSNQVKEELKENGEKAISEGVFGVPTTVARGKLYWGYDATDMVLASLSTDLAVSGSSDWPAAELAAVATLPEGLQRKR